MSTRHLIPNLLAYLSFADSEDAQMPDPLAHHDLIWYSKLSPDHASLAVADFEHAFYANPSGATWGMRKKDASSATRTARKMTCLNPYAELWIRLQFHRYASRLCGAQSDHAISNRFELSETFDPDVPVLKRIPFGRTHARFRNRLSELRERQYSDGLRTDIAGFFPSIDPQVAAQAIATVTDAYLGRVTRLILEKHRSDTGINGIPIGAEISSLLCNLVLRHVDDEVDLRSDVDWDRWTDDYLMLANDRDAIEEVLAVLKEALDDQGLAVSDAKTTLTWDPDYDGTTTDLIDGFIKSQSDLSDLTRNRKPNDKSIRKAENTLFKALIELDPDMSRMRRVLGWLSKVPAEQQPRRRALADLAIENPVAWELAAGRMGNYLAQVCSARQRVRLVSLAGDLIAEQPASDEQIVHVIRAATAKPRVMPSRVLLAQQLLEIARQMQSVPVRGWARHGAYQLDQTTVRQELFGWGEFDLLHSLEKRWAIAYTDGVGQRSFLNDQVQQGQWRATARWRLAESAGGQR